MSWKDYINSGLLELYVAGTLSAQEMERIRALEKEHPELAAEIDKIQQAAMRYARQSAGDFTLPELDESAFETPSDSLQNDPTDHVLQLNNDKNRRWLSIAAAVLLLFASGIAIYMYVQVSNLKRELVEIKTERLLLDSVLAGQLAANDSLLHGLNQMQRQYAEVQEHINSASTQKILLKGLDIDSAAEALVFWNEKTQKVYVSASNLPAVDQQHQYQLWALVDGKPIDAGVFINSNNLQVAKSIARADAFAVTLEPKGGSETPTLEKLYVLGEVAKGNS
ncbi:hypothetical protein GC194_02655 [bacterium]|nr:hypothetical protein [bacterium]